MRERSLLIEPSVHVPGRRGFQEISRGDESQFPAVWEMIYGFSDKEQIQVRAAVERGCVEHLPGLRAYVLESHIRRVAGDGVIQVGGVMAEKVCVLHSGVADVGWVYLYAHS